jgi:hypothetical protein
MEEEKPVERLVESSEVLLRDCQRTQLGYAIGISYKRNGKWLEGYEYYFSEEPFYPSNEEEKVLILEMYQPTKHYFMSTRFVLREK